MKAFLRLVFPTLASAWLAGVAAARADVEWLPTGLPEPPAEGPILCPRDYLTPEQGAAVLQAALKAFPTPDDWQQYGEHLRQRLQQGAGLEPWPRRAPLNPIRHSRRTHDGYTVENVAFESVPGFFATGNLYRPTGAAPGRRAAVLSTHGHSAGIKAPEDYARHGRFHPSAQTRAAALAQQGVVVLTLDMFGYGDSIEQVGQEVHRTPFAMTMQLWNAIRALDFLESLPDVDPTRLMVTGESGGATQAILLTAVDPRVVASVPVVMVSSYFFGGCPCESGRPIHRSVDHFANNTMIAALAAPRPMLLVSDGKDWTRHFPEISFPFLQEIYQRLGATGKVENVHLPEEGHDYGPSKRAALYAFLERLGALSRPWPDLASGVPDESRITVEPPGLLHVFDETHPLPPHALRDAAAVEAALRQLQSPR